MVYPLLPGFVTRTLGAGPVALGALDGAADLTASALRWWSGRLADRPGRRGPLILIGYLVAIVLRPAMALASAAWQVIGIRALDRVGKGLRSPARDAVIADLTPAGTHGRAFGLHRSADHLGAVLGSLLAFELLRRGVPVREVLGWSLWPGVVAFGALLVGLRLARNGADAAAPPLPGPRADSGPAPTMALAGLALLAAARLPETLLLLRLQDRGLPIAMVPLVWGLFHIVKSVGSYPAGVIADRFGSVAVLGLGSLTYAVTVLGLSGDLTPALAIAVFLGHGLAGGLLEPGERAAVARIAGSRRGRAYGSYQAMAGVGALATGLGYGWLYQTRGGSLALAVGALVTGAALLGWLVLVRRGGSPVARA
jgi:MFS family permease